MGELSVADGVWQARAIRAGELSAVAVAEAAIERAARLQPSLNFLVEPLFGAALATARELDRTGGGGPLTGVPMLVKDHLATIAGVRHTEGSRFLADHVAGADSELVRRYRRAGLNIIGTASAPEFALMSTTESRLHAATRNPWDLGLSAGGSSGGSAAAVAAGVVPIAHGNDSGGSLRIPASCCGVFGFKPSRGRNSLAPYEDLDGIWVEHVITRSVRDSAAVLDATHGTAGGGAGGDADQAPAPAGSFLAATEGDPKPIKIAFTVSSPAGYPVADECVAAARRAAMLCESLGHEVSERAPRLDWPAAEEAFLTVFAAACAAWVDGWTVRLRRSPGEDELEPYTRALAACGREIGAAGLLAAVERLQGAARAIDAFFADGCDVLLTPTLAEPPPPLGYFDPPPPPGDALEVLVRDAHFTPFTWVANATGQPAASLPLHWTPGGLPIGVMATARFGHEETLFALAAQLERACPWAHRRPPVRA